MRRRSRTIPRRRAGGRVAIEQRLQVDPVDLDRRAVLEARVAQRLGHRQVGILELDILADDRDPHRLRGRRGAIEQRAPARQLGRRRLDPEMLEHVVIDALLVESERHRVDVLDVVGGNHRLERQTCEQRDLLADVAREHRLRPAEQHVRLDADTAQLVHRVLRRLGLQLPGVLDVRHEREVDEHAAPRPTSTGNWRIASRNGSDSMSPTVPPISVITTSTSRRLGDQRTRCLISSVMCGTTCTVAPR